jgi:hypothetical protein
VHEVRRNKQGHVALMRSFERGSQKIGRTALHIAVAIGVGIPALFFMFRFTAAAAFLVFVLLCILFRLHRSRRALRLAFAVFLIAILVPVDVYVRGFHGPLVNSKHNGLRFVRVVYGFTSGPLDGSEAILGGCSVGIHDSRWRLVRD